MSPTVLNQVFRCKVPCTPWESMAWRAKVCMSSFWSVSFPVKWWSACEARQKYHSEACHIMPSSRDFMRILSPCDHSIDCGFVRWWIGGKGTGLCDPHLHTCIFGGMHDLPNSPNMCYPLDWRPTTPSDGQGKEERDYELAGFNFEFLALSFNLGQGHFWGDSCQSLWLRVFTIIYMSCDSLVMYLKQV